MSPPGSASLRDLYTTQPSSWSFAPPQNNSPTVPPSTTEPAYQWSARPAPNSLLDLSPGLSLEPSSPNVSLLLKTLLASAVLRYTSTAVAMPWEVGRTLLQVQYVPRNADAVSDVWGSGATEEDEVRARSGQMRSFARSCLSASAAQRRVVGRE